MSRIIYTPETKKKKNRFSKKILWSISLFFLFALFLGTALYLSTLSIFKIEQYEVNGNYTVKKSEIESRLNSALVGFHFSFIPKKNYFLVRPAKIENTLLEIFPRIGEISVKKRPFSGLLVQIKEREPWAIFCSSDCFFMDKKGVIYEKSLVGSGSLVRLVKTNPDNFNIGDEALSKDLIASFSSIEDKINSASLGPVTEYDLTSKSQDELKVKTGEGFYIKLNMSDNLEKAFAVLNTVLGEEIKDKRSNLEYIDLRFGNKVFYKYKE